MSGMGRREFVALLGGAAAWPLAARAQQPSVPVVGFLHPGSLAANRYFVAAFRQGLAEAGFVEGRNVAIEFRWANNQLGQLPALAADLVGLPAAVIVAAGAASSPLAAKNATSTIPIVLAGGIDPVKRGFVASLNRPGGNVTGLTLLSTELLGKRLELLSQMVPQATTVAYLSGPSSSLMFEEDTGEILKAAQALGREFIVVEVRSPFDFEAPFATIAQRGAGALIVGIARRLCSPRPRTLITPRRDSAAACAGPRRPCAETQFSAPRGRPLVGGETVE
jgi:putative tryptophan/tyrosine transport system substrate-binding protein